MRTKATHAAGSSKVLKKGAVSTNGMKTVKKYYSIIMVS